MDRPPLLRVIAIVATFASLSLLGVKASVRAAEADKADKTLLGDWRFDEGGGDVAGDSSGHGNDGEIRGADWVKGKFGTALHFGGHDAYVSIPGIASVDGSNELTAEAWVYWEKGGRYPNIITGGTWCPGGFLFFVADNGCSFRLGKPGKAPLQVGKDWAETSANFLQFTPGQWYHLAATFKRPHVQTYVNGKAVASTAWDYPIGFSGDLQIGTWGNPQTCHHGLVDEVKLYNRALTSEEVLADFQRTAAGRGRAGSGEQAYEKIPAKAAVPAVTLDNDLTYCTYIPDEHSTLVGELADCIAKAFNTCRCDMIYLDGSEGMRTSHAVATMKRAIFTKLQGRVLVESSSGSWGAWPFHSRVGAWDHPVYGFNRFTDLHCEGLQRHSASELLPGHMGWWVITGPSADHAGMFPEDMEYFCGKCLGWDWSMSLQGVTAGPTPPNARQNEYLTMLGRYERLRLDRHFSEDVKARLRTPKEQFRLAQDDKGNWQFRPTDYLPHKVTALADGTSTWTVRNRYAAQPAKLRVEALYACKPYDASEGVLVTDFAKPEDFSARAAAAGVTLGLAASAERVKAGIVSASLTAKNATATRRGAWAKVGRVFTPPLDMGKCGAVGVWIYGDGKGELLNFQLNNTHEYYTAWDDHYVDVNFTGWRYYELLLRERDAQRHQDYIWPYGGACEVGRSPILRNRVGSLNVYYNDLPPNEDVKCFLGPVKALPVVKVKLANPTVAIGGSRIVFPVTLESGQFIEYEGPADCRLHDERGAVLQLITPQGDAPKLTPGENPVSFTCDGPAGYNIRAKVTTITQGAPLDSHRQ